MIARQLESKISGNNTYKLWELSEPLEYHKYVLTVSTRKEIQSNDPQEPPTYITATWIVGSSEHGEEVTEPFGWLHGTEDHTAALYVMGVREFK